MKHVLVVDDNEHNLYLLEALLRGHGYTVELARHGAEALDKARQRVPHVVVSDLLMPVMDGYTLLRHWKSDRALQTVPFVVYTATYTDPDDERLARSLGADRFILKPAEPEIILAQIEDSVGTLGASASDEAESERASLALYNAALVRKLEQKMVELADTNRALRDDVERREATEARLRERELALSVASTSARLGGFRLTLPVGALQLSPELRALYPLVADALPDLPALVALFDPSEGRELEAAIARCAAEGAPFDLALRSWRASGTRAWVRVIGQAAPGTSGAVCAIQGVLQDIDAQKRLEEQLRHAQKLEAVGQLAGGIAHDFNNLLAVMLGFSGLALADGRLDDAHASQIREVYKAAERGAELTRQLLAFSHRQVLAPRQLDFGAVIRGMESLLRRLLPTDIELRFSIDAHTGSVLADPTQLEQVVLNLAVNARDAMPRGGRLTLGVRALDVDTPWGRDGVPAGRYVELCVSDTGIGMDEATLSRIFEPFFTTKEKGKGTGLGLATVFGIVTQSAGHLRVDSEPGHGSTFRVYFPRSARPPDLLLHAPPSSPRTLRGTETILLVEDEPQVRAMMAAVLSQQGYDVLAAQNPGDAVLIAEQHPTPIHLLLSDLVMPRLGGRELARRLYALRPDLRVLFVSGYAEPEPSAGELAPSELLPKPFSPEALLTRVRALLDR